MKGTIKVLDPCGHGIIQGDDGKRLPFLFIDVLNRHAVAVGQRVVFAVRTVQGKTFAENISLESAHVRNATKRIVD
jgi:cold shock CspA family protein